MDDLVAHLKALAEPTRLRIASLLARGELTVSELVQVLGQSQPRVSRHLKLLTDAGLVERQPEGAFVFYRLVSSGPGHRLANVIGEMSPPDDPVLKRDLDRLESVKSARAAAAEAYFQRAAEDWDKIRALHLSEHEVEAAMQDAAGSGPFDLMIDVGVGTGRILEVFADRVGEGVGVDVNHAMLNVARLNLERAGLSGASVRKADVSALPFDDGVADLVTVHQVLHYLDDPAVAIAECARVLKPGGVLLIADFAPHQLEFLKTDHAHRRLGFSDEEITDWVESAGLELRRRAALHPEEPENRLTVKIWAARRVPVRTEPGRARSREKSA
ncbi:metalloregulator ArsR/SmtB family transcription factor [Hyphobacterium sp. HN65]|uniref:Metalloregulator ArsR/SmtB family transcription factor n=1 Tax=Hyphobacterium lacteum TaxID=3116575 RepID=A0ABU7LR13_9PROT|nr:metalloregulator ArsR/SmtB family transcription factor [Hyphobacterium sp. HN65]MEE2526346.1 metalloregulator ArsR/SmtB family transcription factor [Hyphobacterium sp. HN65]